MHFLEEFQNPPAKYRIKPFWFWNGEITKEEISRQIGEMARGGLGGMFLCARQGMTVPYLSKEWFDLVEYACEEAKRQGLETWLYDEYPYPSGMSGGEVLLRHPEAEHKVLKHQAFFVSGGEAVRRELGWSKVLHARAYRVVEDGGTAADMDAAVDSECCEEAACARDGNRCGTTDWDDWIDLQDFIGNLQMEKIYQQTGLTKYNNKRFFSYGPNHILDCVLLEGKWRIEVYMEEALGDFKYYGGFFDPCSREAVKTFLETTHERYRRAVGEQFGKNIRGMFSDEVGLLGGIPWSGQLIERFEEANGYSLAEVLPAIHDSSVPGAYKIRYDLYRTVHELFVESYHKQVADWCRDNQLAYATEVPSMRLGTQKYSDIIGGDTAHEKLGKSLDWIYDEYIRNYRSNAKAVSSLARQLDREYAMIESFHSVGWTMTLQDAKWMIDRLGASGINLYNFHAFYYTIADITKHDAPPSQFLQNPYWKHYRKLADYVGRMGVLVSNTEAEISVAVLDPVAAMWTKLGNPFQGFPYAGEDDKERGECDRLRNSWVHICKTLLFHQVDYEHLDGEMLAGAAVEEGKIRLGRAAYSVVILPPCHCMERGAREKLEEFVAQGGCVIAAGQLPSVSVESGESDEETAEAWRRLFERDGAYRLDDGEGMVQLCRNHIRESVRVEVVQGNPRDVISCVRVDQDGQHYAFVANQGAGEVQIGLSVRAADDGSSVTARICDMETGMVMPVERGDKDNPIMVCLGSFESVWIQVGAAPEYESRRKRIPTSPLSGAEPLTIPMDGLWNVTIDGDNIYRFDTVEMSLDGQNWKRAEVKTFLEQCDETKLLGQEKLTYSGTFGTPKKILPAYPLTCRYRLEFELDVVPERLSLLMDTETVAGEYELRINGRVLPADSRRSVWVNDQNNRAADILPMVHTGKNEIQILAAVQKDEDGFRDPLYLWGSFGVAGRDGKAVLTKMPEMAAPDRPWYQGFPYYSGEFCFEKEFKLDVLTKGRGLESLPSDLRLRLGFTVPMYDCAEVEVNGQSLGVKAYTPYEWLCPKDCLRESGNRITVRITNTLANMLDGTYFDYDRHCLVKIEP